LVAPHSNYAGLRLIHLGIAYVFYKNGRKKPNFDILTYHRRVNLA
jgi:hypothetical protein